MVFNYEYTDTFAGDANYCWVKRGKVSVPELTHYGYDGSNGYSKAGKLQMREIMKLVKRDLGLTGVKGRRETGGETEIFYPYGMATVLFVEYDEESDNA